MILFREEHVRPIISGRKTQTRRGSVLPRWNVDAIHQCRTRMLEKSSTFALVRILAVHHEQLLDITGVDAIAEGYEDREDFLRAYCRINRLGDGATLQGLGVWVVRFELAGT